MNNMLGLSTIHFYGVMILVNENVRSEEKLKRREKINMNFNGM